MNRIRRALTPRPDTPAVLLLWIFIGCFCLAALALAGCEAYPL